MRQQQARAALMYRAPVALFHTTDKKNDPANKVRRDGTGMEWDGMGGIHSLERHLCFELACLLCSLAWLLAC